MTVLGQVMLVYLSVSIHELHSFIWTKTHRPNTHRWHREFQRYEITRRAALKQRVQVFTGFTHNTHTHNNKVNKMNWFHILLVWDFILLRSGSSLYKGRRDEKVGMGFSSTRGSPLQNKNASAPAAQGKNRSICLARSLISAHTPHIQPNSHFSHESAYTRPSRTRLSRTYLPLQPATLDVLPRVVMKAYLAYTSEAWFIDSGTAGSPGDLSRNNASCLSSAKVGAGTCCIFCM